MRDALEGYAGGENGRLYRTTNGGANWTLVGSLGRMVTVISWTANGETAFAGGASPGFNASLARMDGATITKFPVWWASEIKSIQYPLDAREGWICTTEFFTHYLDGVENNNQSHPSLSYNRMHMVDHQYGWATGDGSYYTDDNRLVDGGWVVHTEDGHNWAVQFIPDPGLFVDAHTSTLRRASPV